MSKTENGLKNLSVLAALTIIFVGFAFPAVMVYLSAFYGFNIWFTGIFTFLALVGTVSIVFILIVIYPAEQSSGSDKKRRLLREQMIDTLKEIDEFMLDLIDIRDFLKSEE